MNGWMRGGDVCRRVDPSLATKAMCVYLGLCVSGHGPPAASWGRRQAWQQKIKKKRQMVVMGKAITVVV